MEEQNTTSRDLSKFQNRLDVSLEEDVFTNLDAAQEEFSKYNKKNRIINLIVMVVFLVAIALIFFFLHNQGSAYIYVLLALVGLYLVYSLVSSKQIKVKMNILANKVVANYFNYLDSYIFSDPAFSEVKMNANEKFTKEEIESLNLFKNVEHIGSRDYIYGKFLDKDFAFGDALVRTEEIKDDKSQKFIVFLGKMMMLNTQTKVSEGRVVIYLKGKGSNGPTAIDDLTKVDGMLSDKFLVYASGNYQDFFTPEVKDSLEAFSSGEFLLDAFVVVEPTRVGFGLSYADTLMTIPIFEKIKRETVTLYKGDFDKEVKFLKVISK